VFPGVATSPSGSDGVPVVVTDDQLG